MLFGHWSAKLIRRSRDFARCANVSGEDRQNGRDIAERNVSTPGEPCADEDCCVGNPIRDFVIKLADL